MAKNPEISSGPPRSVWVEVATELLAKFGEWSEPVRIRIDDLRPDGRVEMVLQEFNDGKAALAEALRLLYHLATWCGCGDDGRCANIEAHDLLVRHGLRRVPEGEAPCETRPHRA